MLNIEKLYYGIFICRVDHNNFINILLFKLKTNKILAFQNFISIHKNKIEVKDRLHLR